VCCILVCAMVHRNSLCTHPHSTVTMAAFTWRHLLAGAGAALGWQTQTLHCQLRLPLPRVLSRRTHPHRLVSVALVGVVRVVAVACVVRRLWWLALVAQE
jgi:hypothetical protein